MITNMDATPRGLRRHIALFGKTNTGKSTLFNMLIGQQNAIVSPEAGTTTDPVFKNMELLPFGPVTLIDTAGLEDDTPLGAQRTQKTRDAARRADIGLVLREAARPEEPELSFFTGKKIPVFTKCDMIGAEGLEQLKRQHPNALFVSRGQPDSLEALKQALAAALAKLEEGETDTLIGDLLPAGSTVIMVVPTDSEAPKGRLILPQVQLIRDCLDHRINALVTNEAQLENALAQIHAPGVVVTDSQAFALVNRLVPPHIPLTSFSLLLARQKWDFPLMLKGAESLDSLKPGDKILMLEACTHNSTHEDIGRVKIPGLINRRVGKGLEYDFFSGYTLPESPEGYSLVIMCGGCMINRREALSRLEIMTAHGLPVTNYGIVLAFLTGALERCKEFFTGAGIE